MIWKPADEFGARTSWAGAPAATWLATVLRNILLSARTASSREPRTEFTNRNAAAVNAIANTSVASTVMRTRTEPIRRRAAAVLATVDHPVSRPRHRLQGSCAEGLIDL